MTVATTDTTMGTRAQVRDWIAEAWSPEITVREWWRRLAEARLSQPQWPSPYGRGSSTADARVVVEELVAARTIAPPEGGVAVGLAGPTLLAHGTPEQHTRFLPSLLRGEESWCQLFSEPGAGSDLPSLTTRAVETPDGWSVTGQKVWSSNAQLARRGLLLARTDPASSGRRGISFFVVDMAQPAIEVRPIHQMDGLARFCEVFLDGARVRECDRVGDLGDGWTVARTTLAHERANTARRPARGLTFVPSGEIAGHLDHTTGDVISSERGEAPSFTGRAIPARRLAALARELGVALTPETRDQLVRYLVTTEVHRTNQRRTPAPHPSITKLLVSKICYSSREVSYSILGADAMLDDGDAPFGGALHRVGLGSFGVSIGGGTDEIQRNHLAERVLGLPRDPSAP
jgi:alkylation response protein AidB-like acyl-CoA dehydrogenase